MTWPDQKARIAAFARDPDARFDMGDWATDARVIKHTISGLRDERDDLRKGLRLLLDGIDAADGWPEHVGDVAVFVRELLAAADVAA